MNISTRMISGRMAHASQGRAWGRGVWLLAMLWLLAAAAQAAGPGSAASLRAKYAALSAEFSNSPFQRPVHLDSVESSRDSSGDIYAVVGYPYGTVSTELNNPAHWCDVLNLHLNTKDCRAVTDGSGTVLEMRVGKKYDQPLADAYRLAFTYRVVSMTPEYFDIELDAPSGPMGTRDYHMLLEAIPIDGGRTFLHLGYAFGYGAASHLAFQAYLATLGSGKVGFTTVASADGQTAYIGGIRGLVERNTMRYYLAIDAYLDGLSAPPADQLEKRLQTWFTATEKYPRQLHEIDRATYLDMKRSQLRRP